MPPSAFPRLLSPLRIRSTELRNRVAFTAHGSFLDFYRPGEPPDRYASYLERRARGGAGLVILQPVHVHPSSQALNHHVYEPGDLAAKLAHVADRIHAHGAAAMVQLMHFGAEFDTAARTDLQPLWGFSTTTSPTSGEVAHEMTEAEILEVIDGFARTARIAREAGLDGVELHATHGYLVQQSFSPWANRRTDSWGDQRRFLTSTLRAIRDAVGPDAIVSTRLSVDDYTPPARGGLGPQGLQQVARDLVDEGLVDLINTSAGARAAHYARAVASYQHPHGLLLEAAHGMRDAIGGRVPLVGVGRITSPEGAERALAEGRCDLVAMTRAQIADPDVVVKLTRPGLPPIRPCVGANSGCVDRMSLSLPITCLHNPDVGREARGDPEPARAPGHVVVVGGGPAGMKAAEIAAVRGHRVTLLERDGELGGRYRLATTFGAAAELGGALQWVAQRLEALGVDVVLGSDADPAAVIGRSPDAVVLACGARPVPEELDGVDGIPVWSTDQAMLVEAGPGGPVAGGHTLVVDHLGTLEVSRTAERLAAAGAAVTVVTPGPVFGHAVGFTQVKDQVRRLVEHGATIRTGTRFSGAADGRARLTDLVTGQRHDVAVDAIVAGIPARARDGLRVPLESAGLRVLLAGDAVAPRTAMLAFREGDGAGRAV